MKVIIIGLGVQGRKRRMIAGQDFVGAVDPVNAEAEYKTLALVPLENYDAALVCTPDETKIDLITYLLQNGKHVLVEKPLLGSAQALHQLEKIAQENHVICYTAYNHRFEPHLVRVRDTIQSGELGRLYHCRFFYGNGTARLVKNSVWRDQGGGVLPDLGSHLLDLIDFIFSQRNNSYKILFSHCFENNAPDHVTFVNADSEPKFECEMMLLSWRNDFSCDIYAELGSVHVRSLCKWGPSKFIYRKRILPSGRPPEQVVTLVQDDPTWGLEYEYFKSLISKKVKTDLSKDIWISQQLEKLNQTAKRINTSCQVI